MITLMVKMVISATTMEPGLVMTSIAIGNLTTTSEVLTAIMTSTAVTITTSSVMVSFDDGSWLISST